MTKEKMKAMLDQQVDGLTNFANGYRACAKFVLDEFEKEEQENDGTRLQVN